MTVCIIFATVFPVKASIDSEKKPVVSMTLFSYFMYPLDNGHAWLYFENLCDDTLKVGAYDLESSESVSVGTFKYTRADGGGVYYNVESYCVEKYGAKNRVSLTVDLTKAELEEITNEINSSNYFTFFTNCSFFAAKIWNKGSGKFVPPFFLPPVSYFVILAYAGEYQREIKGAPAEKVYKHIGSGSDSSLKLVSPESLIARL